MLISKFNLYKTEWLDLVFEDRNKDYGAYYLRQHYAGTMVRAMVITFLSIGALCGGVILFTNAKPVYHITEVVTPPIVVLPVTPPVKKVEPPKPVIPIKARPTSPSITTVKVVPPVVVPDQQAKNPIKIDEIKGTISTVDAKGTDNIKNTPIPDVPSGLSAVAAPGNTIQPLSSLDFMPEPVGGNAAWSKFLNKNLRFPPAAQDDGVSGKVFVSFIIEKDGSLSNIVLEKGAGHGFDEEALRVLKLAKAWKPGMQNGQAVRVKYSIPINFQAVEQ